MRRTLRASWTITFSGSWRRRAASPQRLVATLRSPALRISSRGWKVPDIRARANTHPGLILEEKRTTSTPTIKIRTTSTILELGRARWRQRSPWVSFRGAWRRAITGPSVAAMQTEWDPTPRSKQGTSMDEFKRVLFVFILDLIAQIFLLFFMNVFLHTEVELVHSLEDCSEKTKMCDLVAYWALQRKRRKTRRFLCGWRRDRKKWFNIKEVHTGRSKLSSSSFLPVFRKCISIGDISWYFIWRYFIDLKCR